MIFTVIELVPGRFYVQLATADDEFHWTLGILDREEVAQLLS